MSDTPKFPFDSIALDGGAADPGVSPAIADLPRPSFSRSVPDTSAFGLLPPSRKPLAVSVPEPTPTLPPMPVDPTDPPVSPPLGSTPPPKAGSLRGFLWDLVRPTRTKWAVLAGGASLVAGAYGLNLVVPNQTPALKNELSETARVDGPAPLVLAERQPSPSVGEERTGGEVVRAVHEELAPAPLPVVPAGGPALVVRGQAPVDPEPAPLPSPTLPKPDDKLPAPVDPVPLPKPADPVLPPVTEDPPKSTPLPPVPLPGVGEKTEPASPTLPPVRPDPEPPVTAVPLPSPGLPPVPLDDKPTPLPPVTEEKPTPIVPIDDKKDKEGGPTPLPSPVTPFNEQPDPKPVGLPPVVDPNIIPVPDVKPIGDPKPVEPVPVPLPSPGVTLPPVDDPKPVVLPPVGGTDPKDKKPVDPRPMLPAPVDPKPLVPIDPKPVEPPVEPDLTPSTPLFKEAPAVTPTAGVKEPPPETVGGPPPKKGFDVDVVRLRGSETYASISEAYYQSRKYAAALQAFNGNADIGRLQEVEVPPLYELQKQFGSPVRTADPVGDPRAFPPVRGPVVAPASGTGDRIEWGPSGQRQPTTRYERYTTPKDGMTLRDVARTVYADANEWTKLLGPGGARLYPDDPLPRGTELTVPRTELAWK